jgi:hypothetical protein
VSPVVTGRGPAFGRTEPRIRPHRSVFYWVRSAEPYRADTASMSSRTRLGVRDSSGWDTRYLTWSRLYGEVGFSGWVVGVSSLKEARERLLCASGDGQAAFESGDRAALGGLPTRLPRPRVGGRRGGTMHVESHWKHDDWPH